MSSQQTDTTHVRRWRHLAGLATAITVAALAAPTAASANDGTWYSPYVGVSPYAEPVGEISVGQLVTPDGRSRSYRMYVPASLRSASRRVPLVIALHGGMGSAAQFEQNSGFDGLAESNRFLVVYPEGIGSSADGARGPQTWNGGYCCGPAMNRGIDDVEFIRQLIATIRTKYRVDPSRVFVTGHSNGGILAYRLACELSDTIAAIGVQSASLGVDQCTPRRPVSVIHIHGTADTNHPIEGGTGSGISKVDFRSALSSVEALVTANRCAKLAASTALNTLGNPDLTTTTWSRCRGNTEVRFVKVDSAGHAWMGHPSMSAQADDYMGPPYPDLDTSKAIWAFLAAHPRG